MVRKEIDAPGDPHRRGKIAGQVQQRPDAVAAVCEGRSLTYRAIDRSANRLVKRLLSLGAGPGSVIGLCMYPSLELATAMLAVLKAGAAYVRLPPNLPGERLSVPRRRAWLTTENAHSPAAKD